MKLLSEEVLLDKIRGCFLGKNVGGTLGAPFEGKKEMNDVEFYTQKLDGNPLPNDDLDLQLLWLVMAEYYGLEHLTSPHFGEYWLNAVTGPWGEYAHCRWNCLEGFFPPLSGSCENDFYRYSNGAWIRSEIWACLCARDAFRGEDILPDRTRNDGHPAGNLIARYVLPAFGSDYGGTRMSECNHRPGPEQSSGFISGT